MNKKEVKEYIKKNIEKGLESVLSGKKDSIKLEHSTPSVVSNYLSKKYDSREHSIDINGWDWSMLFDVDSKTYILSGDSYYSNDLYFSLDN